VQISVSNVEILAFYEIQYGRRLPSWICWGSRGTTHEGPVVVAIPRKNFAMISIAVLKNYVFEFLSFMLESLIHVHKISIFGVSHPKFTGTLFTSPKITS